MAVKCACLHISGAAELARLVARLRAAGATVAEAEGEQRETQLELVDFRITLDWDLPPDQISQVRALVSVLHARI
jgi:hypothetical protein